VPSRATKVGSLIGSRLNGILPVRTTGDLSPHGYGRRPDVGLLALGFNEHFVPKVNCEGPVVVQGTATTLTRDNQMTDVRADQPNRSLSVTSIGQVSGIRVIIEPFSTQ
jgi:hypothetical protein